MDKTKQPEIKPEDLEKRKFPDKEKTIEPEATKLGDETAP